MKNLSTLFGKDNLDEIVFANRNKSYGAYALRNDYSNHLTKAVIIGVAFFASLSIIPLIISAVEAKAVVPTDDFSGREIIAINEPEVIKPKVSAVAPTKVKTVASETFTPVRVVKVDKPAPTKKEKENAAVSSVTSDGPETTMTAAPPVIKLGPPAIPQTYTPPVKVEDPNIIVDAAKVDVAAEFKGGIEAFRQKVAQNFDTETVDKTGMVSGVITFVVEKDGSITNLKVSGSNFDFNSEAERTVKSIKTKWTPAQVKGKTVRSSFRMPISMKIE